MKIVLVIWELSKFDQIRPEKKNKKNTFGYLRLSEGYEYPTLYDQQFTRYGKSSNFVIIKLLCSFKPGRSLNFSVVKRGTNSKGVFI